ncbi:MAG TPA: nucleoside deaminase [Bacteroidales bacterium]|nr:nucleoside deaminase [Bacteroidales bacterium]
MDHINKYLSRSVDLAMDGMKNGGGPFGAVITMNDEIISEAFNRVVPDNDPTAHAEILAIRRAAAKLKNHDLTGCTIYSSCEPCPMCLSAIYWSGIKTVYYSLSREDAAKAGFNDKFIYDELALDPSSRKISLIHLGQPAGAEIFKTWENLENKIAY